MDYDARRELHRELVYRLQRELVFYRSLHALMERQRDAAERGAEADLALSYGELGTIMKGLEESQFAVSTMREKEPTLFQAATRMPPVPELVRQACEILQATHQILQDGTRAARSHCRRLQQELAQLSREHDAMRAYTGLPPAGHVLDGRR
jgi:hypothetical protein